MSREGIAAAVAKIRAVTDVVPSLAMVCGSGLGALADGVDGASIPYADIPGFPEPTVPTHAGRLCLGTLHGVPVVAMQGRLHLYEGHCAQSVAFPIRVMQALGAKILILTNAAGGLNPDISTGEFVLIEDHLSLAHLSGGDPLRGANDEAIGPRFLGLNKAYDPALLRLAEAAFAEQGVWSRRGVYAHAVGPSFETPAEVRLFQMVGCDVVGMSTAPETVAARHCGMKVLAISTVTNQAISSVDDDAVANESDVWATLQEAAPRLGTVMPTLIRALHAHLKESDEGSS